MLAVIAGELSPIMTGLMYCSVIEACREVYALSRAREWTFALSRWCEQQSEMVAFTGTCLVHRAEIMQFHGAWPDAMAEACRACERSRGPTASRLPPRSISRPRYIVCAASLRKPTRRIAPRAGWDATHNPGSPCCGWPRDAPTRRARRSAGSSSATTDRLQRARLLPAHLEIMLAAGDIEEARSACRELQALAESFDTDVLQAMAAQAQGALELAEGDARAALGPLRARSRRGNGSRRLTSLRACACSSGLACRALGDDEAGALEFGAARAAFERTRSPAGARSPRVRSTNVHRRARSTR